MTTASSSKTLLNMPSVIGHRGACGCAPENTLISLHTAADMGCKWVEIDVKLTKDFVPIIMHDDTLDRTTSGHGFVKDTNYRDLTELDAGHWFGDSFIGTKIPTLEEAIDVILQRRMGVNLEIKPCAGREVDTAEVMLDFISKIWDEPSQILISSFSYVALETAMDMAPHFARGLLLESQPDPNWPDMIEYFTPHTINFSADSIAREFVEDLMDYQLPLYAYTVNDQQTSLQLRQWGVDGFFTNMPDVIFDDLFKSN